MYRFDFRVEMSMFVLIYGVLFSLHFISYECDGKSLSSFLDISQVELNINVWVYDVNHYLAFITRYIMPVGCSHLLYGDAHRVICFAYPRILPVHFETYNNY